SSLGNLEHRRCGADADAGGRALVSLFYSCEVYLGPRPRAQAPSTGSQVGEARSGAGSNCQEDSAMSAEYGGKRQRGDGDGPKAAINPSKNSGATSSAVLESMLKQALGRIDSLERQHEEIKAAMGREIKVLMDDVCRLKEENKKIQASMERQTKALRDDVNSLQSGNKALKWSLDLLASKVQEGWEYPVAIQPDEYWENKGYDDQAIELLMSSFFGELNNAVSDLGHGVCDSIQVGYVGYVNHDEDLMPHWKALFRYFDYINPYDSGVKLNLQNMELNEEVMRQICHNLRNRNISQVEFTNNGFLDNGFANMRGAISELGKALKSPKLKSLTWSENPIESTEDMTLFTRVLSQKSALDELKFTWNSNDNAQALLSGVDFSTYKVLDFSGNNLQTNGRTDISDLIAANSPLKELNLDRNRLNDDDAVLIAQSLGRNTHLTKLYMNYSNIQERGMRALHGTVNDTSTLNALSDSNHTCLLIGLSGNFNLYAINSDRGSNGLYMNRMFKIHKLMVERYRNGGGNVPHLNTEMRGENSVLLAPYLMESVVRRHDAFPKKYNKSSECSLGLLYELVKDWKMAELFSFSRRKGSRDLTSSRPRGMVALGLHAYPAFFSAVLGAVTGEGVRAPSPRRLLRPEGFTSSRPPGPYAAAPPSHPLVAGPCRCRVLGAVAPLGAPSSYPLVLSSAASPSESADASLDDWDGPFSPCSPPLLGDNVTGYCTRSRRAETAAAASFPFPRASVAVAASTAIAEHGPPPAAGARRMCLAEFARVRIFSRLVAPSVQAAVEAPGNLARRLSSAPPFPIAQPARRTLRPDMSDRFLGSHADGRSRPPPSPLPGGATALRGAPPVRKDNRRTRPVAA
ncbi:hypothetical protein THAOC_32546, partial [Thalassiosira oceanica]